MLFRIHRKGRDDIVQLIQIESSELASKNVLSLLGELNGVDANERGAISPQFGQRAIVEDIGDGVARFDHDEPDSAGLQICAVLTWPEGRDGSTGDRREGANERSHDRAHSDFMCGTREPIAAALSLLGIDEPARRNSVRM
jgi:hypothetical protein